MYLVSILMEQYQNSRLIGKFFFEVSNWTYTPYEDWITARLWLYDKFSANFSICTLMYQRIILVKWFDITWIAIPHIELTIRKHKRVKGSWIQAFVEEVCFWTVIFSFLPVYLKKSYQPSMPSERLLHRTREICFQSANSTIIKKSVQTMTC